MLIKLDFLFKSMYEEKRSYYLPKNIHVKLQIFHQMQYGFIILGTICPIKIDN